MAQIKIWLKENQDSVLLIVGIISGVIFGIILKSMFNLSPLALTYIGLGGKIIVRAITMIMVPFMIASLSTSIIGLKTGENRRLITLTVSLIIVSVSFVSLFGAIIVSVMKPGVRESVADSNLTQVEPSYDYRHGFASQDEAIYDLFINLIPDNIIGSTVMTDVTVLVPIDPKNISLGYKKVLEKAFKSNMMGLAVFALILGLTVLRLGQSADTIKNILTEINDISMWILLNLIKIMPIGMFSMMCAQTIEMKSPGNVLVQLGWFLITTLLTYSILCLIVFPTIYSLTVRKNPLKFYYNLIPAILVAVATASSTLTLPMTFKCMEKNKLAKPISQFVLPLAVNMHLPGSAIYFVMMPLFVAQMENTQVTLQMILTLCIYIVIITLAIPTTPGGSGSKSAFYIVLCSTVGVKNPLNVLVYILTFDWIIDRIRTSTNVTGDCILSVVIEKYCFDKNYTNDTQEYDPTH